ncbi:MAG: CBS domain-containing protein [Bacteroidetes bacterium]|nr:CBS domain-containing protein [Bacteroidota bacterium]
MRKVSDILNRKGRAITSVSPDTKVIDALQLMADKNIGSVIVMENDRFLGIMTERDYSRKVILKGHSSTNTAVSEIMAVNCTAVKETDTVDDCMKILSDQNLRYLPVMENDTLVGFLSVYDIISEILLSQKDTISELKNYIQS